MRGEKAKQLFLLLWWQQLRSGLYFGKSAHERNLAHEGRRPEAVSEVTVSSTKQLVHYIQQLRRVDWFGHVGIEAGPQ